MSQLGIKAYSGKWGFMGLYDEITRARQILDIPERASIGKINSKYKEALKKWHPDTSREDKTLSEEKTREILYAGKTLLDYCNRYPITFSREEVEKHISQEEFWAKKFGNDPIWGNPDAGR